MKVDRHCEAVPAFSGDNEAIFSLIQHPSPLLRMRGNPMKTLGGPSALRWVHIK